MKRILCYGDSNTWGYTPITGARYDEHTRWTGHLRDVLGEDYYVQEEGLNARTSAFDDPFKPYLNGKDMLEGILVSAKPLDVLVISLGTNDLKFVDAWHAAQGVGLLLDMARSMDVRYPSTQPVFPNGFKAIVVSPIEIGEDLAKRPGYSTLKYGHEQSLLFAKEFETMCQAKGAVMVDAAKLAKPSFADCIHMEPAGHAALAEGIAAAVRSLT